MESNNAKALEVMKELGLPGEISYVTEPRVVDATNPEVRAELIKQHYTEKEIQYAINNGDTFEIDGKHQLHRGPE
jgi:hypothetical protein